MLGFLARRLTRPLDEIVHVARDIGDGKLDSRMELGRHHTGELGELAETFNDMATRIQKYCGVSRMSWSRFFRK